MSGCTAPVPTPILDEFGNPHCGLGSGMVAVCSTGVAVRAGTGSTGCSIDAPRLWSTTCDGRPAFCSAVSVVDGCGSWVSACRALGATDCIAEVDPVTGEATEIRPL